MNRQARGLMLVVVLSSISCSDDDAASKDSAVVTDQAASKKDGQTADKNLSSDGLNSEASIKKDGTSQDGAASLPEAFALIAANYDAKMTSVTGSGADCFDKDSIYSVTITSEGKFSFTNAKKQLEFVWDPKTDLNTVNSTITILSLIHTGQTLQATVTSGKLSQLSGGFVSPPGGWSTGSNGITKK